MTRPAWSIYYEASPAPDNTRALCFLDGHVKRVPEAEWPQPQGRLARPEHARAHLTPARWQSMRLN